MQETIFNAALAGLLHDIGKMEQRARADPWKPPEGFEDTGQPVHAAWTAWFVHHYVASVHRPAARHAAYHHHPEKSPASDPSLSQLVALADKLSAGERADEQPEGSRPPQQMVSTFNRLTGLKQPPSAEMSYLPLKPLALREDALFPKVPDKPASPQETQAAYGELVEIIRKAASQQIPDQETYLEELLAAFQQAAWCVPSAYYHNLPDISLYDHSRMTAALAVCLAEMDKDRLQKLHEAVKLAFTSGKDATVLAEPVALLVGGDISGVQDFIYTLTSKGAARTLRGRSFYLQLLTEAVLRFILRYLGLPYTNVIYSGGGNFFLLAPVSAAEKLPELRKLVTQKILRHHGSELYLAIGSAPLPASGLRIGEFPAYWSEMHAAIGRAKQQRYAELGEELHGEIFERPKTGGNPDTCSVCGGDRLKTQVYDLEREEQARICTLCQSFQDVIGKDLPHAYFAALGFGQPETTKARDIHAALAEFGMQFALLERGKALPKMAGAERLVVWALDDPDAKGYPLGSSLPAAHVLRYTVNLIPQVRSQQEAKEINEKLSTSEQSDPARKGQPKTFTHLEAQSGGFKRLGALRMDVDDLGLIFQKGFDLPDGKSSRATLARIATLSFQTLLFFDGWLKVICANYPEQVYAVYAGGDDLFLIAPWNIVPGLARHLRKDFGRWTCEHPGMGLSGGMAFIGGKYPIYQAAEDAHEAEQQAKDLPGKDAFSFLGQAMGWDDFDKLAARKEQLVQLVSKDGKENEGGGGPTSILQTLRRLAIQEAVVAKDRPRPVWGPWVWQGAYRLTRLVEQYGKKEGSISAEIARIRDELSDNDFREIYPWGTAARWAQLATRKPNQED